MIPMIFRVFSADLLVYIFVDVLLLLLWCLSLSLLINQSITISFSLSFLHLIAIRGFRCERNQIQTIRNEYNWLSYQTVANRLN